MEENLIAAIELGSSAISGIVGQKFTNGEMKVLAYASIPSESAIRHGVVYNSEKAASIIVELIEKLKSLSGCEINMVYVTHNGKSLRSSVSEVETVFDAIKVVEDIDTDKMLQECEEQQIEGKSRLFIYPQEFTLDNKQTKEKDPVGVSCTTLKGRYLSVVVNSKVIEDVQRTFDRASTPVEDCFLSIVGVADYLLDETDRQQGCALVDFGADTTTLAIYKNGILKYLRVLPIGSSLITSDLATMLRITYSEAENLKRTYGLASLNSSQDLNETIFINSRKITVKEIAAIIEARNEEILRNLDAQIKNSGLGDLLYAGMYVIGGGSNLRQLSKAIQKSVDNIGNVHFIKEPANSVDWVESKWMKNDGTQLSLLSILNLERENCCTKIIFDEIDHLSPTEEGNLQQQSLFTEDGQSAQEERDRIEAAKKVAEQIQKQNEAKVTETGEEPVRESKKTGYFKGLFSSARNLVEKLADKTENFFDEDQNTDNVQENDDTNK